MGLTWENRSTRRKTCPNATLSTTNLTWTNPASNPGLRGYRPATNRLSHDMAVTYTHIALIIVALAMSIRIFRLLSGAAPILCSVTGCLLPKVSTPHLQVSDVQ